MPAEETPRKTLTRKEILKRINEKDPITALAEAEAAHLEEHFRTTKDLRFRQAARALCRTPGKAGRSQSDDDGPLLEMAWMLERGECSKIWAAARCVAKKIAGPHHLITSVTHRLNKKFRASECGFRFYVQSLASATYFQSIIDDITARYSSLEFAGRHCLPKNSPFSAMVTLNMNCPLIDFIERESPYRPLVGR